MPLSIINKLYPVMCCRCFRKLVAYTLFGVMLVCCHVLDNNGMVCSHTMAGSVCYVYIILHVLSAVH